MKTVCCWMRRKDACWHIGYWISTYEGSRNGKSVWRYVGGDSGRGVIPLDWIRHRARAASYETTVDDRVSIAVTGRYSAHHLTLTFTTSFPPNFLWKHSCKVDVWAWTKDIVTVKLLESPSCSARAEICGFIQMTVGTMPRAQMLRKLCEIIKGHTRWRLSRYREITSVCIQAKGLFS